MKVNQESVSTLVDLYLHKMIRENKSCDECKMNEEDQILEDTDLLEDEDLDEGIGSSLVQYLKDLTPAAKKAAQIARNKKALRVGQKVGSQMNAMGRSIVR